MAIMRTLLGIILGTLTRVMRAHGAVLVNATFRNTSQNISSKKTWENVAVSNNLQK